MTLLARISVGLGVFLIAAGVVYGVFAGDYEGLTLIMTVAGGALLIGVYLTRAVQRAQVTLTERPSGAGETEPHVEPTIWPLVFALSMIGLVVGAVAARWALVGCAVLLVVACVGWILDVRRQWRHHRGGGASGEVTHGPDGGVQQG